MLDQLKAACEEFERLQKAATEGPWGVCSCSLNGPCPHRRGVRVSFCHEDLPERSRWPRDAELAVHARNTNLPALAKQAVEWAEKEIKSKDAEIERLRQLIDDCIPDSCKPLT